MDVTEIKGAIDGLMTSFEAYKATNDQRLAEIQAKGTADPLTVEKLAKIEQTVSGFEALNQRVTQAEGKAATVKELDERLAAMEAKQGRPGVLRGRAADPIGYKQRQDLWLRAVIGANTIGINNLPTDQQKVLADATAEAKSMSLANETTGGYLAVSEYVTEIIKGVTEISPVRSLVRVRPTVNKSLLQPTRTGQFAAAWTAEQGTRAETTGLAYGMKEIPNHEMYALIDISHQNLEDSAFDLEAEVRGEAAEQFALAEGTAVVSGNGVGKPEGWMTNADVSTTNSGHATLITADGMMTLKHAIKTFYTSNATWVMNRTTLGSVRKLKDGDGNYLWMPGIALGRPNTIDGDPYVEVPDMPSEGAGLKPIAYGDFRRAYVLVDRISMNMLRDTYTQATSGNIRFLFYRRVGGQVVLAEAIRTLTCAA